LVQLTDFVYDGIELLRTKKVTTTHGRQMMEEATNLKKEIKSLSQTLAQEQERNEIVERVFLLFCCLHISKTTF
jgi:DNA gyrase/topoisomerase IV subunit A